MTEDDWIELYRAHMPPLYRTVSRRVGARRALAEDLTQETWLRALNAWSRTGVPDDPAAWLVTVASNLLRNHYRRPEAAALPDGAAELDAAGEQPDHAAGVAAERADALQRGLAHLRPAQAELLTERHLDGRSLAELATSRGLSERAVEGRLRRARSALARRIDASILDDEPTSA